MTDSADELPPPDLAQPETSIKRDALGHFCFWLHLVVMVYIVAGWTIPADGALAFYIAFMPVVVVQWVFNKNACVMNNVESYLRTGSWRDANNREEGNWLGTLIEDVTGLSFSLGQMNVFTYGVMGLLWLLGILHYVYW